MWRDLKSMVWALVSGAILLGNLAAHAQAQHLGDVIERISSDRFLEREKATADLLAIAKKDLEAVRSKSTHVDSEVRERIGMVIDLVELELPLGTSTQQITWVKRFAKGGEQQKIDVLIDALVRAPNSVARGLYRRVKQVEQRKKLLNSVVSPPGMAINNQQISYLLSLESLIMSEEDKELRRSVLLSFFQRFGWYITRGAGKKRLVHRIKTHEDADIRRACLMAFEHSIHNSDIVVELCEDGSLVVIINACVSELDDQERTRMLSGLSQLGESIRRAKLKEGIFSELLNDLTPEGAAAVLPGWTKQSNVHEAILEDVPAKRLAEIYGSIPKASVNNRLLARLFALRGWNKSGEDPTALMTYLSSASTAIEKRARTAGAFESWASQSTNHRKSIRVEAIDQAWGMIKHADADWQVEPLVLAFGLPDLFGKRTEPLIVPKLLERLKRCDEETVKEFVSRLSRTPALTEQLGDQRLTVGLIKWLSKTHASYWTTYGSQILARQDLFRTADKQDVRDILDLLKDSSKSTYFPQAIARNQTLLSHFLKNGHYDDLVRLVEPSAPNSAWVNFRAALMTQEAAIEFISKEKRLDELLFFEAKHIDQQRLSQTLSTLCRSRVFVEAIIKAKYLDRFTEVVAKHDNVRSSQPLMGHLAKHAAYRELMIKRGELASILKSCDSMNQRCVMAVSLLTGADKTKFPDDPELALLLWEPVCKSSDYRVSSLAQSLFRLAWFRDQVVSLEKKGDPRFQEMIRSDKRRRWRSALTSYMSRELSKQLFEGNGLQFLTPFVRASDEATARQIASSAVHSSHISNQLSKDDFVEKIIKRLESRDVDALTVEMFVQVMSYRRQKEDDLEKRLWAIFKDEAADAKAKVALRMLTAVGPSEMLGKSEAYGALKDILENSSGESPAWVAAELMNSQRATEHLVRSGYGETITEIVLSSNEPIQTTLVQKWHLLTGPARDVLDDKRFREVAEELVDQTRQIMVAKTSISPYVISNLLSSRKLDRMIEAEQLDPIIEIVSSIANQPSALPMFYCNNDVAKYMRSQGRSSGELVEIFRTMDVRYLDYSLYSALTRPEPVAWILDEFPIDVVEELIARLKGNGGSWARQNLASNQALLSYFLRRGDLEPLMQSTLMTSTKTQHHELFSRIMMSTDMSTLIQAPKLKHQLVGWLLNEPKPNLKEQMFNAMVYRPAMLDMVWQTGNVQYLISYVESETSNTGRKSSKVTHVQSSIKRYAKHLIEQRDLKAAEPVLRELMQGDSDRPGYIYFLKVAGLLPQAIKAQRVRIESMEDVGQQQQARQMLLWMLRAAGDSECVSLAELEGPELAWRLAIEQHDWPKALELTEKVANESKVVNKDKVASKPSGKLLEVEALGARASLAHFAGMIALRDQHVGELVEWFDSHRSDAKEMRDATAAMIIAGDEARAYQLVSRYFGRRDFFFQRARRMYDPALYSVRFDAHKVAECYDRYCGGENANQASRTAATVTILQLRKLLVQTGRIEQARKIDEVLIDALKSLAMSERDRDSFSRLLVHQMQRVEVERKTLYRVIAPSVQDGVGPSSHYYSLYRNEWGAQLRDEAMLWWALSYEKHPKKSTIDHLRFVDDILQGRAEPSTVKDLIQGVTKVKEYRKVSVTRNGKRTTTTSPTYRQFHVPESLWRLGLEKEAVEMIDALEKPSSTDLVLLARMAMKRGNNRSASDQFLLAWDESQKPMYLFCAGLVLESTNPEKGKELMRRARLVAFGKYDAIHIVRLLRSDDIADRYAKTAELLARDIAEDVTAMAEPSSTVYLEALFQLAMLTKDHHAAAEMTREFAVSHLRRQRHFFAPDDPIHFAVQIQVLQAMGAIDDGNMEMAREKWETGQRIAKGSERWTKAMVEKLIKANEDEWARQIFDEHRSFVTARAEKFGSDYLNQEVESLDKFWNEIAKD